MDERTIHIQYCEDNDYKEDLQQSEDELEKILEKNCKENEEGKLEEWQVITHIFKAFVGPGVLGLPSAVMHGGLIVGPIILVFLGLVCMYNIKLLVNTSKRIRQSLEIDEISYSAISGHLFSVYGPKVSNIARLATDFLLCSLQIGFCCVYVVFISHNLQAFVGKLDVRLWMLILLPFLLVTVVKSNIKNLSYLTTTGNVIVLVSLGIIFQYLLTHFSGLSNLPKFNGLEKLCIASGQIIFAFEGIAVILPTENRLKRRESFDWLLQLAAAFIIGIYASLGLTGYFTFGEKTLGSITLNLPNTTLFQTVQCLVSVMVFFTYPLQMLVSVEIMNKYLSPNQSSESQRWIDGTLLRIVLVISTCIISMTIPQLDNFIALVGALGGTCIAVMMPPILHTLCFWEYGITNKQLCINIMIILLGIVLCISGTIAALSSIMENYINNSNTTTRLIRD